MRACIGTSAKRVDDVMAGVTNLTLGDDDDGA